ncbi:MAG: hypothetical protein HOQ05_05995 [Corynebacteriales bacterium]|nr:hypothetical protein [Mycobacteriales bacterium]
MRTTSTTAEENVVILLCARDLARDFVAETEPSAPPGLRLQSGSDSARHRVKSGNKVRLPSNREVAGSGGKPEPAGVDEHADFDTLKRIAAARERQLFLALRRSIDELCAAEPEIHRTLPSRFYFCRFGRGKACVHLLAIHSAGGESAAPKERSNIVWVP